MAGGSYRGGSTLLKVWTSFKSKPRSEGLLTREARFVGAAIEPKGPLVTEKNKLPRKRKKGPVVDRQLANNSTEAPKTAPVQIPLARKAVVTAKAKYNPGEIVSYLAAHHPACPKRVRKRIGQIAAEGRWTGLALDTMTQRCVAHYVVGEVCGVHRLVECGFSAAAANQMIEPQRKAVMKLWGF